MSGDSIIITDYNDKGYRVSIINSRYNDFEINFFNLLSIKNQNILDYYYRKILPNPKFPKLSSAQATYDSSLSLLTKSLKEDRISEKYYQWAKKIISLSYNTQTENPQKPDSAILFDFTNVSNHYYRAFLHLYLINFKMKSTFAKVDFEDAYTFSKNNFEGPIKEYFLFFTTKNLIEKNDRLKSKFIKRFDEDTFNETYKEYFKINYSEKKQSAERNIQNQLTKVDNAVFTFKDLIAENKEKLIYVDFWASWCLPCIAEIPNSLKLAEEYKDKDVQFIYISIDSKKMDWDGARIKYGLNKEKASFLLNNAKESEIVKRFKINEIPRYILIDKKGNVISDNAPGPGSAEIKKLFDKYIDE